jgi:hypothetical protein
VNPEADVDLRSGFAHSLAAMTPEEWLALRRLYTRNLKLRALDYANEEDRKLYHPVHDPAHDPVARLLRTIEDEDAQSVQLVAGFRGTGKTTEFSRLEARLRERGYLVARIDLDEHLDHHSPVDVREFLLVLAGALGERLLDPDLLGEDDGLRLGFWHEMKGLLPELSVDLLTVRDAVGAIEKTVEWKRALREDRDFREQVRAAIGGRLPFLEGAVRSWLGRVLDALRIRHGHSRLVVIVDSLEHIRGTYETAPAVHESVRELFITHGRRLTLPGTHTIFSVPAFMALYADNVTAEFAGALLAWSAFHVSRRAADGALVPDDSTIDRLVALVERRIDWSRILADRDALIEVIRASGGSMRDLLKMLAEALAAVPDPDSARVPASVPIAAVQRSYAALWADQIEVLKSVAERRGFEGLESRHREQVAAFLDAGVVLCYLNGDFWYDVHPLVKPRVAP